jgi:N-acylglucosamine 2-epimerase
MVNQMTIDPLIMAGLYRMGKFDNFIPFWRNYSKEIKYGEIYYYLDIKGYPVHQLEWDQSLLKVCLENLKIIMKGQYHTGETDYLMRYGKVYNYTLAHFPNQEHR